PAHHARRRDPAALLDRRAAQPRQRPARRDGDHRASPDHPGAGRAVHRAPLPVRAEQYPERQRGRLALKPGITGWAQVNGRASLPWSERIELDLWYIEHRSLRIDATILWRTLRMLLGGEGLYRGETGGWRPT